VIPDYDAIVLDRMLPGTWMASNCAKNCASDGISTASTNADRQGHDRPIAWKASTRAAADDYPLSSRSRLMN